MKQILTICSAVLLTGASLTAQEGRIKKAEKLTDKLAYAEAIEYYDSILEQGVDSARIADDVANAHYQMRDPEGAEEWYAVVVENSPKPEDYLRYAEMLKSNGKYAKAQVYMSKYNDLNAQDSRANKHVINANYYIELSQESDKFQLRNETNNSKLADFSPSYYGENVVFCSNRELLGVSVKRKHKWNNAPLLNLFLSKPGNEGKLENIRPFSEKLNTKYHEGPSTFTRDLKRMYFTRNNFIDKKARKSSDDIIKLKIYSSEKTDLGWSDPEEFPYNSNEYSVGHPTLSLDGKTMYFVSDMPGGYGGTDLWKCKSESGQWSKPENMGSLINSEGNEMFPFIHQDGTLYFASDGLLGLGGLDVFEARPNSKGFESPENLKAPINSPRDDFGFIVNQEKSEGYLSSNRLNGKGDDDIYHFYMENITPLTISGTVVNADDNMNPLQGARVRLVDAYGKVLETENMDETGYFMFELDPEHCGYKIQVDNGSGWSDYSNDNAPCDVEEGDIGLGNIPLEEMKYGATGIVKDKSTSAPIDGFNVSLLNKNTGEELTKVTSTDGLARFSLEPNTDYKLTFEKDGYFAKSGNISTVGMEPGVIELERYIDLRFEKIEIGKAIKIENIYYDYDKSFIRSDAAIELNKIVKLLRDNPSIKIEMGSHTDSRGSDVYNLKLSQRRAKSAMEYIISQGISKNRMSWKGYGETILVNNCRNGVKCDDQTHEENRRTEFKVVGFVEGLIE